ncbi:hypothetical protein RHO12_07725 [Orbus sturtevantii]|uniref:hypothetical protein n=1 Tax=Orbus sturtevantii TaxID=3074109 RepID=UPI00370D6C10
MNSEKLNTQLKKIESELDISSTESGTQAKLSFCFSPFSLPLGSRDPDFKDIEYFQIYFIGLADALKNRKIDLHQYADYRYKLLSIFNKKITLSQQALPNLLFDLEENIEEDTELTEVDSQLKALYRELYNKDFMSKEYLDCEIKRWSSVRY